MTRTACALALLLLSACKMGPDYHLPAGAKINDPAAQRPFINTAPGVAQDDPVPTNWWYLFNDARLDRLERQALAANTDLRAASANLAHADAVVREARSLQGINGDASFAGERAQLSGESYLLPKQLPTQYLGDGEIHVAYQLDLFGRLKRATEAAKDDREAAIAGRDLARIMVAAEVARAFVEACGAGHELAAAQHQIALQLRSQEVTRQLVATGRDSSLTLTETDQLLAELQAGVPPLLVRRRAALYRLAVLVGAAPADYPRDVENCDHLPPILTPLPVGDGTTLLKRRPDIREAERHLAAATARIGAATAALYPDVTLGATAGSIGLLSDLTKPAAETWGVGSLISWTFPTGGEQARVQQASALAEAALAKFDGTVLNALRETETSLMLYAQDINRRAALRVVRDRAADRVAEAESLVDAGRSPFLHGLSARQSLAASDQNLAAADTQLAQDQVNLFLALGGGWQLAVTK